MMCDDNFPQSFFFKKFVHKVRAVIDQRGNEVRQMVFTLYVEEKAAAQFMTINYHN